MHTNQRLIEQLVTQHFPEPGLVYEIGSGNKSGNCRGLMEGLGWTYRGLDTPEPGRVYDVGGPNSQIDYLLPDKGPWDRGDIPLADLVISAQGINHVKKPWFWILQVAKLGHPESGLIMVSHHEQSVVDEWRKDDFWRIMPGGMKVLAEYACFDVRTFGLSGNDCYLVALHSGNSLSFARLPALRGTDVDKK